LLPLGSIFSTSFEEWSTRRAVVGSDDLYQNARLARAFPVSAFPDVSQHPALADSFDSSYLNASNGDRAHVTTCSLAIGERQTVG
jgi:hypothetical protein